jgi:outer membrane protein TolC
MFRLTSYLVLSALLAPVYGQSISLDESLIKTLLQDESPQWKLLEAQGLSGLLGNKLVDENFQTSLEASYRYSESDERELNTFQPVTSPIHSYKLGITRPTAYGAKVGVAATTEQITNSFLTKATTTAVTLDGSLDLYKDFMGRLSNGELERTRLGSEADSLRSGVEKHLLLSNARKIYWSLVANQESLKITNELLKSSEKQVEEANRRFKNNIADEGEVARYRSQVASRKASIVLLEYERETLYKAVRDLFPSLADKDIKLAKYDIDKTVQNVVSCMMTISAQKTLPNDFTNYDEIIDLVTKQYAVEQHMTSVHSGPDLKLLGQYKYTGKDFSYSDSISDLQDQGKGGFQMGVTLTIPLEGKSSDTEDVKKLVEKNRFEGNAKRDFSKMAAMHQQVVRSISLLNQILNNQEENTKQLQKSLQVSQKKYNQARLSVQQLVQEQDAYLQSNLDEIQTKLIFISTLLDYFGVFTLTPCELNRI